MAIVGASQSGPVVPNLRVGTWRGNQWLSLFLELHMTRRTNEMDPSEDCEDSFFGCRAKHSKRLAFVSDLVQRISHGISKKNLVDQPGMVELTFLWVLQLQVGSKHVLHVSNMIHTRPSRRDEVSHPSYPTLPDSMQAQSCGSNPKAKWKAESVRVTILTNS